MGLGVLDDKKLERVPGTATLEDLQSPGTADVRRDSQPKHAADGTILVPQPSDSPNDPLNWPLWRRDLITCILCLLSVVASTLSPLLAANTLTFIRYFDPPRSIPEIALLTGWYLFGVGITGFLIVPSGRIWGKRHLYIFGTVVIIISSIWGGASGNNYNSLLAARVFQGVGLAPFEAFVNHSVGDMYFVHQRGKRMALSNLCLFGGAFFTPVIVGKTTASIGWWWTFYFVAIFAGLLLPALIFFCPETAFNREEPLETHSLEDYEPNPSSGASSLEPKEPKGTVQPLSTPQTHPPPAILSHANLALFNGRKTNESFLKLLLRPFPLFFHPGIFWACLTQGLIIGWTVLIGIVLGAIMFGPPLFFNEVETGYMYTGAFIGALIGFALAGLLADSSAKWMTKRNGGVYEPEFRLVLVIPMLIFGCAGLYGFGITSDNTTRYGWFWPDFFFALEVCGMVLGAVASALYVVDAHKEVAIEAFTCLLIFKNLFSFGLTFSGLDWLIEGGIRETFVAISSVQVVVCCLTVLMYVFGKKNRSFFARHDMLKMLHLD